MEGRATSTSPRYLGPKASYLARARYLDLRRYNLERASYLEKGGISRSGRDNSKGGRVISLSELTRFRSEVSRRCRGNSRSLETSRLVQAPDVCTDYM